MADRILGLPTTDKLRAQSAYLGDLRRRILEFYPNAGLTLTGLASLVPSEGLSDKLHHWFERRYREMGSTTRGTAPLTKTAPSTGDADDGTAADTTAVGAVSTSLWLKVNSIVDYRIGQIVSIDPVGNNIQFRVVAVIPGVSDAQANGVLKVNLVRALSAYTSGNYTAGTYLACIGDAHGEGTGSTAGLGLKLPIQLQNYAQFMRTRYDLPEETIRIPEIYNTKGPWQDRVKQAAIEHFGYIEKSLLFGKRSLRTDAVVLSGGDSDMSTETVGTTGGVFEQMALWDAGSTGISINGATHAPYSHKSAGSSDSDKLIIANTAGTLSYETLCNYFVRSNTAIKRNSGERMAICSQNTMLLINKMVRMEALVEQMQSDSVYGLDITTLKMPTGKLHFVTHPLWNDPLNVHGLKDTIFLCDPTSWKFREFYPTKKAENIQANDSTTRKDELRSYFSLEFNGIESNMLIKNVTSAVRSN